MSLVQAIRRASAGDLVLAAQVAAVAVVVEVGLRVASLPTVARWLRVIVETGSPAPGVEPYRPGVLPQEVVRRLSVAWRLLGHRPFNGTCLRRALVGAWVVRSQTHFVRLGVRKFDGRIAAHAWLVVCGVSLDPDADLRFTTLTSPDERTDPGPA